MSMDWTQGFNVLLNDAFELQYRIGTMEAHTGQLCLIPEMFVPVSRRTRFVFGTDLGWSIQAQQHELGMETHSTEYHTPSYPGGSETFAVDSTYDVDVINPFLFGIHVGFEFIPAKYWFIRADATPMFSNIYGPKSPAQHPVYLRITAGYRCIRGKG